MPNFYISLDEKFDELINKARINENKIFINVNEIISLKSYIYDIYMKDNEYENEYLRKELKLIDLSI
jgi:hypothetical protein